MEEKVVKRLVGIEVIKPGSNPDVDSDFMTEIREKVVDHVEELNGRGHVANIVTFQTLAAKAAFKEMCKIYSIPFAQANKVTKMIPGPVSGVNITFSDIFNPDSPRYNEATDFRNAVSGEEWKEVIAGSLAIEGRIKSSGVHPCGIIMSSKPLDSVVPLHVRQSDSKLISQWTYPELEEMGLIKFDFLGLDTVDLIMNSVRYIGRNGKQAPSMTKLIHGDLQDKKTLDLFGRGDTIGIFQFSEEFVRDLFKRMKPDSVIDLAITTALCRPGPMGMKSHVKFADRKAGREKIEFPIHPDFKGTVLEEILEPTLSLIVFQEQILEISNKIGGMTLQEGDNLRKAMGKKDREKMKKMKTVFMDGGLKNGYTDESLKALWETMAIFAEYGFNRCLHGRTLVNIEGEGKITLDELFKKQEENPNEKINVLSMFEDGSLKYHKVKNVTKSGRKPLFTIKTESGKRIRLTKEHRMLTTGGYGTIEDGLLRIGAELMFDESWGKRLSKKTIQTKKKTMSLVNRMDSQREKARNHMTKYQKTLSFDDRSAHQKKIQLNNPNRSNASLSAAREKLKSLYLDPEWMNKFINSCEQTRIKKAETGEYKGFGKMTKLSDGRWCDSIQEAAVGEYLILRGIDFELHKKLVTKEGKIKVCDFYANGLYFEFDGLNRGKDFFVENKYGNEIPFVYMTPYNFQEVIDEAIMNLHVENGDKIIEIIPPKVGKTGVEYTEMTFDIEMEYDGPSNFIADGLVSHNSHSVAYALNSYQSAYLKANYPVEFMAALIAQNVGVKDKILTYLQEAKRMGLSVGSVDINLSDVRVAPDYAKKSSHDILYGIGGISAVSEDSATLIVNEREKNGEYSSVQDLINRCVPLGVDNKRIYTALAFAGAFDSFNHPRRGVVENLPAMLTEAKTQKVKGSTLFDMLGDAGSSPTSIDLDSVPEYPHLEKLSKESEVIGLYLTSHPLSNVGTLSGLNSTPISKILKSNSNGKYNVVGSVTEIVTKRQKRGGKSIAVTIDDGSGFITAFLNRNLVKGMDKKDAQNKIKSLYETGAHEVSSEIEMMALDEEFTAVEPIEIGQVYNVELVFKPGFDDNPYSARISESNKIHLADNGSLPVRIRMNKPKTKETKMKQMAFFKKLSEVFPGDSPIFIGYKDDLIEKTNDDVYRDAIDVIRTNVPTAESDKHEETEQSLTGRVKKSVNKRASKNTPEKKLLPWPPPKQHRSGVFENDKITSTLTAEKIESLNYRPTPFMVDKSDKLTQVIEQKVGIENYDFGIFNAAILDDNGR